MIDPRGEGEGSEEETKGLVVRRSRRTRWGRPGPARKVPAHSAVVGEPDGDPRKNGAPAAAARLTRIRAVQKGWADRLGARHRGWQSGHEGGAEPAPGIFGSGIPIGRDPRKPDGIVAVQGSITWAEVALIASRKRVGVFGSW